MNIETGSIIEGKVVRIKPFGAIVLIGNNLQGLVHISHISNDFVQDINNHLNVGDIIKVKVLSVDEQNKKISLSIKEAIKETSLEEIDPHPVPNPAPADSSQAFEEKFKEWLKASNERHAGINKRNKRR